MSKDPMDIDPARISIYLRLKAAAKRASDLSAYAAQCAAASEAAQMELDSYENDLHAMAKVSADLFTIDPEQGKFIPK